MKCFYHSDLDGQASAFIVHAWVGINDCNVSPEFIEINYGTEFPLDIIYPGEQVWIVDYSIHPNEMRKLLAVTDDVTWIDHHKTAIEKYEGFERGIAGIRRDGTAGCVLTWEWVHWMTGRGSGMLSGDQVVENSQNLPVPRCIQLVGDRDVWKWEFGDETRHFFSGAMLHNTSPASEFWWQCMEHEIEDLPPPNTGNRAARIRGEKFWAQLLRDGETIERYKAQSDKGITESIGYDVEWLGYKCFACNRARVSSDRFGSRIKEYDILLPHYHDGKQWTVSLYSEKVDVSEIAKARGGGGHKGASGFQCKDLPWMLANLTDGLTGAM